MHEPIRPLARSYDAVLRSVAIQVPLGFVHRWHRTACAFLGAFLLVMASQATAASIAPSSACSAAKSKATAHAFRCVVSATNGSLQSGRSLDLSACESRLDADFQAAESEGPCTLSGDSSSAWALAVSTEQAALDLLAVDTATTREEIACVAARNRSVGRLVACDNKITRGFLRHGNSHPRFSRSDCEDRLWLKFTDTSGESASPPLPLLPFSIDLVARTAGMYMRGVDLSGQNLNFTNLLAGADLTGADLHNAQFSGADLSSAMLANANLKSVYFRQAFLNDADVQGSDVTGAILELANVLGTNFNGVDLSAAADLTALHTGSVSGCPAILPAFWACGGNVLTGPSVDLSASELDGSDLHGRVLTNVQFPTTSLQGADLSNADLTGAFFWYTDLTGANFTNATLTSAYFDFAILNGAQFVGAVNAGFQGIDLSSFDLSAADLSGAALTQENNGFGVLACPLGLPADWICRDGNLYGPSVSLVLGSLAGADLHGLHLSHAALSLTDMTGADLSGTDLSVALLVGTILTGANLTSVNLESAILTDAVFDSVQWNNTTCPDGTNSDANGGSCCAHLAGQAPMSCGP